MLAHVAGLVGTVPYNIALAGLAKLFVRICMAGGVRVYGCIRSQ
jgi:hypothetical protein